MYRDNSAVGAGVSHLVRWGGVRQDGSRGAPQEQGMPTYSEGGVGGRDRATGLVCSGVGWEVSPWKELRRKRKQERRARTGGKCKNEVETAIENGGWGFSASL